MNATDLVVGQRIFVRETGYGIVKKIIDSQWALLAIEGRELPNYFLIPDHQISICTKTNNSHTI